MLWHKTGLPLSKPTVSVLGNEIIYPIPYKGWNNDKSIQERPGPF